MCTHTHTPFHLTWSSERFTSGNPLGIVLQVESGRSGRSFAHTWISKVVVASPSGFLPEYSPSSWLTFQAVKFLYVFGDEMMRATIIVVNIVLVDTVPSILISDKFIVYMAVIFYSIWINRNLITYGSSTPIYRILLSWFSRV